MTATLQAYLKQVLLVTLGLIVTIFAIGFVDGFFSAMFVIVFLFTFPFWAAGVVAGYLFYLVRAVSLVRSKDISRQGKALAVIALPVSACILVFAFLPSLSFGALSGDFGRLLWSKSSYETIIAQNGLGAGGDRLLQTGTANGVDFEIDAGPPVRIAFEPDGFLDNWSGIVYDPTGAVMLAKGFDRDGNFHAPERITKLFGGDLVSCRHFFDHYYRCNFT